MSVEKFRESIALFNGQKFFECHEVLEGVWHAEKGTDKRFYQGILQFAVALEHFRRGNHGGFLKVLWDARDSLANYPSPHLGVRVRKLCEDLDSWWDFASGKVQQQPPFPNIEFTKGIIVA